MNEDVEMDVDMPENQPFHLVEDMDLCCMWKGENSWGKLLAKKLATFLDAFNNKNSLHQDLKNRLLNNGKDNLEAVLRAGTFKIHKTAMIDSTPPNWNDR